MKTTWMLAAVAVLGLGSATFGQEPGTGTREPGKRAAELRARRAERQGERPAVSPEVRQKLEAARQRVREAVRDLARVRAEAGVGAGRMAPGARREIRERIGEMRPGMGRGELRRRGPFFAPRLRGRLEKSPRLPRTGPETGRPGARL